MHSLAEIADDLYKEKRVPEPSIKISTVHGHRTYYELIEAMARIHAAKNQDYGGGNPLGNFLNSLDLGVDPFLGILIRLSDKWSRICSLTKTERQMVKDESIEDTLIDLANYALLAIVLRRHKANLASFPSIEDWNCGDRGCNHCTCGPEGACEGHRI